jgi:Predicted metal binding domain
VESVLVDPDVTRSKFDRELDLWKEHGDREHRGWLLLREDHENLMVELALIVGLPTSTPGLLPIVVCAIRLTYENYDLWPPSLTFIDVLSREPSPPRVRALQATPQGPSDVLIAIHPSIERPFVCLPGIREYHSHPQHTGDNWLLHRPMNEGSISTISERLWRMMAKNVLGLQIGVMTLPNLPFQAHVSVQLVQGELQAAPIAPQIADKQEKT